MNFDLSKKNLAPEYLAGYAAIIFFVLVIVHTIFAIAVYRDTKGRETRLVWPILWALVTLFMGPLLAGVYWVVNRLALDESFSLL